MALLFQACTESIVQDGHATSAIVVPKDAPVEVLRAAKELQIYVQKTSGVELKITAADGEPRKERVEIRLAVSPLGIAPGGNPDTQIVHEDGYEIRSGGRLISIMGGSPRGTLYGVYDFIERTLGVRWFMPTTMGEDTLEAKTIPVPELAMVKNPAFPSVGGFTWAGSPGAEDWELRMRVRVGKEVRFGHNWYNIYPYTRESFAKNPEMFAMVGGTRGRSTQLCSSNEDVVRVSVEAARAAFKAHPEAPLFSISPNDGGGFCQCERCQKIDALYGVTDGSLSDRFVHYANEVLTELEKTNPGKQVGIYAYSEYTSPPRKARPKANYVTALTHMPWEFCHVHSIDDTSCPANRRFLAYLKGWQALTKHVGVYEYYGHFFAFTPWPIVHSIRRDIPLFKKLGIERFTSETQQNWANQGINFYVAAKLADNPAIDVDALLAEYFARFYGKARDPMRRYFDLWEDAMLQTAAAGDRGYAWLSIFTPARVSEAAILLQKAGELAATDREQVRQRVDFARVGFGYTEAYAQMLDAGLRNDPQAVHSWSEEAQRRVRATEGSAPQAFFVSLAIDQTRYLARILDQGVAPWVALRPVPFPDPTPSPGP
ncbi:MAG: DUF4838 domain-containing protein [Vicinamibacteria bacterium]|nr:DUF4838 domain-containing protein [Vicinamibacteria bacterium]